MSRPFPTVRADDLFDRASPLARLRGFLVDAGIAFAVFVPVMFVSVWARDLPPEVVPWAVGVTVLALPSWWLVQSVRLGRGGQTEGMRRAGVWLVDARTGRPAGVVRAGILRRVLYLVYLVPGVGTLLALFDALVLVRRNGRTLLDRLTGTVVLKDLAPEAAAERLATLGPSRAEPRLATASTAQRAGALTVDLALTLTLLAPMFVLAATTEDGARPEPWFTIAAVGFFLVPVLWLVQSVRIGRNGRTVGMRRAGVRLVDARTLRPAGVVRAFVRRVLSASYLALPLGALLLLLDAAVFLRDDGRALLDRLTGTVVLRDSPDDLSSP